MDIKARQAEVSNSVPKARGIYVAVPIGERLRPFDKDPRRNSALINENFVKIGKADNFKQRCRKYVADNDGDVTFEAVVITDHLTIEQHKYFENILKTHFDDFRICNPSGRKTEWMTGIDPITVKAEILKLFEEYENNLKLNEKNC